MANTTVLLVNCGSAGGEVETTNTDIAAGCAAAEQMNADADAAAAAAQAQAQAERDAQAAKAAQLAADQAAQLNELRAEIAGYVDAGVVHPALAAMAKIIGAVQ